MVAPRHRPLLFAVLSAACAVTLAFSALWGAEATTIADLLGALGLPLGEPSAVNILRVLRLPRVLLAALVGAALALSGTALQAVFRNPLADPYLLGVSAGGAFGAGLAMLAQEHWPIAPLVPLCAGVGALGTVALVWTLSRAAHGGPTAALLLTGVAVSTLWMALMSFLVLRGANDQTVFFMRMHAWMLGGFDRTVGLQQPLLAAPYLLVGMAVLGAQAPALNLLLLGDETAYSLGLEVAKTRRTVLILASLLTAAAVCVTGLIGFVGLVAPHAVRLLLGPDHRWLLPGAALVGATFLVVCDALARTVAAPTEIPVGIFSALLGVPFFLYLLRTSRRLPT